MDSVKAALDVYMLKMSLARGEITVKLAGEGRKRKSARMNRILGQIGQIKLKKGRITSLHSKLNNMSAREICGEKM